MNDRLGIIRLTADLPGIGGRIKEEPEDFLVEEVPLYPAAGQGSFCFLFIEKTSLSTLQLVDLLRRRLGLEDQDIGLAGWKDRRAVTRQWVSAPQRQVTEPILEQLRHDGLHILHRSRHVSGHTPLGVTNMNAGVLSTRRMFACLCRLSDKTCQLPSKGRQHPQRGLPLSLPTGSKLRD